MKGGRSTIPKADPEKVKQPLKQKEKITKESVIPPCTDDSLKIIKDELVKDIDANDTENLTLCTEYVTDIYRYLRKSEVTTLISLWGYEVEGRVLLGDIPYRRSSRIEIFRPPSLNNRIH